MNQSLPTGQYEPFFSPEKIVPFAIWIMHSTPLQGRWEFDWFFSPSIQYGKIWTYLRCWCLTGAHNILTVPVLVLRERSLSTHCVTMDTLRVHRGGYQIQRPEELPCRPVPPICCTLVSHSSLPPPLPYDLNLLKVWFFSKCEYLMLLWDLLCHMVHYILGHRSFAHFHPKSLPFLESSERNILEVYAYIFVLAFVSMPSFIDPMHIFYIWKKFTPPNEMSQKLDTHVHCRFGDIVVVAIHCWHKYINKHFW